MTTQQGIDQGFAIVDAPVHWSHNGNVTACGKHVRYASGTTGHLTATSDLESVKCGLCLAAPTMPCRKSVVVPAPADAPTPTGYTEVDCQVCHGTGQIPRVHTRAVVGHGEKYEQIYGTVCGLGLRPDDVVFVVAENGNDSTCAECTASTEVGRVGGTVGNNMTTPTGHQHLHLLYVKGRWDWVVRDSSRLCKTTRCRKVTVTPE